MPGCKTDNCAISLYNLNAVKCCILVFWGETMNEEEMSISNGVFCIYRKLTGRAQKYPEQKEVVIGKIPEAM